MVGVDCAALTDWPSSTGMATTVPSMVAVIRVWPSSDSAVLIEIFDCLMEAFSSATFALAAAKESCADSKFSLEVACSFHKASSRLYFFSALESAISAETNFA